MRQVIVKVFHLKWLKSLSGIPITFEIFEILRVLIIIYSNVTNMEFVKKNYFVRYEQNRCQPI